MPVPVRLIAVDPSLTCTGWALFHVKNGKPIRGGVLKPLSTKVVLAHRLADLQRSVELLLAELELEEGDVLICEGPAPLVLNPSSSLKVEQVRSIFEAVARTRGLIVPGRLNPRTVQTELLGLKGKQLARKEVKTWARSVANRLFGNDLSGILDNSSQSPPQDVIDALLIGALAVTKIQLAARMNVCVSEVLSSSRNSSSRSRWGQLARAR